LKITISMIKADIGSYPGHVKVHEDVMKVCEESLKEAKNDGLIIDYRIFNAGDDTELLMTHTHGIDAEVIHKFSWDTFIKGTEKAKELGLYGAGQDLLADAFSGNIKGMGPGVAEMEIEERPAESFIVFAADKTEPGAFNYPVFKIFADPFNTAGLVIDPKMHAGFKFTVLDVFEHKKVTLNTPEEMYELLALIGTTGRYPIKHVESKKCA